MIKNSPFGVLEFLQWNHDWNFYKYSSSEQLQKSIDLMKECGAATVRMDFLWEDIEPKQGSFSFEKYDLIVDLLNKNNITILGLLNYTAPWASVNGKTNHSPKDNKLFVNYAAGVVERYKNKIKYWEVWNEPDSAVYWSDQDGLKGYSGLLKDVYQELKTVDPNCIILNGGLANGIESVRQLYANNTKDYFDILNIHYFDSPLHELSIERVVAYPQQAYEVMQKYGDNQKKIWITEIGCPGVRKGIKTRNWWLGENPDE